MSAEHRPQPHAHPEPSKEAASEMSFTAALKRAVDDLFTHQVIGDKLQGIAENEALAALVENWQQGLTRHLQDEAQTKVQHVTGTLEMIRSSGGIVVSEAERLEWQRIEAWHKPFTVTSVCREDLRRILSAEEITTLSDNDMARIADKMSDAYRDSGGYWESLEMMARSVVQRHAIGEPAASPQDRDSQAKTD